LTDRDIIVRAVAEGKGPDECTVEETMTRDVLYVFADETMEVLVRIMGGLQIRRLPVISRENRLVGIVSLGDLAMRLDDRTAGEALRYVSEPVATAPLTAFEEPV
jgi:CBS domain-containing protein